MRYIFILMSVIALSSCGHLDNHETPQNDGSPSSHQGADSDGGGITSAGDPVSHTIVSGMIVHQRGVEHTYDGDFQYTRKSHATVTLIYYEGADGPSTTISVSRYPWPQWTELPLEFTVAADSHTGTLEDLFSKPGTYALSVKVHSIAGDEIRVGDLMNEFSIEFDEPTEGLEVRVTGIEHCDSEDSGGFCTDLK